MYLLYAISVQLSLYGDITYFTYLIMLMFQQGNNEIKVKWLANDIQAFTDLSDVIGWRVIGNQWSVSTRSDIEVEYFYNISASM